MLISAVIFGLIYVYLKIVYTTAYCCTQLECLIEYGLSQSSTPVKSRLMRFYLKWPGAFSLIILGAGFATTYLSHILTNSIFTPLISWAILSTILYTLSEKAALLFKRSLLAQEIHALATDQQTNKSKDRIELCSLLIQLNYKQHEKFLKDYRNKMQEFDDMIANWPTSPPRSKPRVD